MKKLAKKTPMTLPAIKEVVYDENFVHRVAFCRALDGTAYVRVAVSPATRVDDKQVILPESEKIVTIENPEQVAEENPTGVLAKFLKSVEDMVDEYE